MYNEINRECAELNKSADEQFEAEKLKQQILDLKNLRANLYRHGRSCINCKNVACLSFAGKNNKDYVDCKDFEYLYQNEYGEMMKND